MICSLETPLPLLVSTMALSKRCTFGPPVCSSKCEWQSLPPPKVLSPNEAEAFCQGSVLRGARHDLALHLSDGEMSLWEGDYYYFIIPMFPMRKRRLIEQA